MFSKHKLYLRIYLFREFQCCADKLMLCTLSGPPSSESWWLQSDQPSVHGHICVSMCCYQVWKQTFTHLYITLYCYWTEKKLIFKQHYSFLWSNLRWINMRITCVCWLNTGEGSGMSVKLHLCESRWFLAMFIDKKYQIL